MHAPLSDQHVIPSLAACRGTPRRHRSCSYVYKTAAAAMHVYRKLSARHDTIHEPCVPDTLLALIEACNVHDEDTPQRRGGGL